MKIQVAFAALLAAASSLPASAARLPSPFDATKHCYDASVPYRLGAHHGGKVCVKNPDKNYSNLVWK